MVLYLHGVVGVKTYSKATVTQDWSELATNVVESSTFWQAFTCVRPESNLWNIFHLLAHYQQLILELLIM